MGEPTQHFQDAGRAAAFRAAHSALASLADAALAGAQVGRSELAAVLGLGTLRGLGRRRVADAHFKVVAITAANGLLARIRHANRRRVCNVLVERLWARTNRRVSGRTLGRWLRAVERGGPAVLLDRRGRPRGHRPLDRDLALGFVSLVAQGQTLKTAHAATLARAVAESRPWPRSVRTVSLLLRAGAMPVVDPLPPMTGTWSYLGQTDVARN